MNKYAAEVEGISGDYYPEYRNESRSLDGFDLAIIWLNQHENKEAYLMKRDFTIEDLKI